MNIAAGTTPDSSLGSIEAETGPKVDTRSAYLSGVFEMPRPEGFEFENLNDAQAQELIRLSILSFLRRGNIVFTDKMIRNLGYIASHESCLVRNLSRSRNYSRFVVLTRELGHRFLSWHVAEIGMYDFTLFGPAAYEQVGGSEFYRSIDFPPELISRMVISVYQETAPDKIERHFASVLAPRMGRWVNDAELFQLALDFGLDENKAEIPSLMKVIRRFDSTSAHYSFRIVRDSSLKRSRLMPVAQWLIAQEEDFVRTSPKRVTVTVAAEGVAANDDPDIQARVEQVRADAAAAHSKVNDLQSSNAALQAEIDNLRLKLGDVQREAAAEKTVLSAQIEALQAQLRKVSGSSIKVNQGTTARSQPAEESTISLHEARRDFKVLLTATAGSHRAFNIFLTLLEFSLDGHEGLTAQQIVSELDKKRRGLRDRSPEGVDEMIRELVTKYPSLIGPAGRAELHTSPADVSNGNGRTVRMMRYKLSFRNSR